MSELPPGWISSPLEYLADQITKGTTPTTLGFDYKATGVNFVKIENINNNRIQTKTISQFISDEAHEALSRSSLEEYDVLFSIAGTIGKTALVTEGDLPANTNQAIAIIRVNRTVIDHCYLQYQ
jgi:type I restriction enzyme S subunit